MKHTVEVMIPEAEIKARIAELGRQINERYKDSGSDMVLVGLLRGSFMFMADLCRACLPRSRFHDGIQLWQRNVYYA